MEGPAPAVPLGLFLGAAVVMAISALFEEVAFRAGLVGVLRHGLPEWAAVAVPALSFGLVHMSNPGANAMSAASAVLAGAAFGALYLMIRPPSLGLVAGFHFAWNETLALLGIPVSGTTSPVAHLLVTAEDALWSGGTFGLEASPATMLVYAGVLAIALWRSAARR